MPSDLGLIEVAPRNAGPAFSETVDSALQVMAPDAVASEVAPGRFGVLGAENSAGIAAIAASLEATLRVKGNDVSVASHSLPLAAGALTPAQTARALRQALSVFARGGAAGLSRAGFAAGLAGYVNQAAVHAGALRRAIQARRFRLLFQPIVSLRDRTLHHHEALLRPEPVSGCPFGNPQEFVTLVETLGLAEELDFAVADLTCAASIASAVPIAFNLSAQSVQSAAFRDRLLSRLAPNPACRTGRLMVEMTETYEVENLAEAVRTAEALRGIGVPFCLDDFGTGGADLRVLRALPADIVKLDGSYVPGVVRAGRELSFVAGMVAIARARGAEVVAERIETEAEAKAMQAVGITYGQGWLFGRPGALPTPDRGHTIERAE